MFLWPVLLLLWTKVIFYEITEIATNKLQKTNKKGSKTKKTQKNPEYSPCSINAILE